MDALPELNFKDDIEAAYKELKLIPINGQEYAVDKILTEFFINNKRNVIISADTGTGKSIIGAVVAKVFKNKFPEASDSEENIKPATIVVNSNSLVKQYGDTFKGFKMEEFHQIIGARNYECQAGNNLPENKIKKISCTGEDCFIKMADNKTMETYCNKCEYNIAKNMVNYTDVLITNYSYHFLTSTYNLGRKKRILHVFDEAHNLNEVFCDHCEITFSNESLERYIDELSKNYACVGLSVIEEITKIKNDLIKDMIQEDNYNDYLKRLKNAYSTISNKLTKEAELADINEYMKLKRVARKYDSLAMKIVDFFRHNYDHVFELKIPNDYEKRRGITLKTVSIKPIFVKDMSETFMSEYNLFMSATISDVFMKQTIGLDDDDTAFIKLPSVYSPDNKSVTFCGNQKLSFEALKKPETMANLREMVESVVSYANENDYKGLLLTPSFKMSEDLISAIPKGTKIFQHKPGEKIDEIVREFKAYKGKSILVSPSIYEGLDFPDDASRYQIIVKAPYASLGDKRIAHIASAYPEVYRIMTIMKIVQGIGRSCRNKDDWCLTFVTDKNAEDLFKSHLNVWKDQFTIT